MGTELLCCATVVPAALASDHHSTHSSLEFTAGLGFRVRVFGFQYSGCPRILSALFVERASLGERWRRDSV